MHPEIHSFKQVGKRKDGIRQELNFIKNRILRKSSGDVDSV